MKNKLVYVAAGFTAGLIVGVITPLWMILLVAAATGFVGFVVFTTPGEDEEE